MTTEQLNDAIEAVDLMVRDRIGSAYEVFLEDGCIYISAPRDEDEAESTNCPTCEMVMLASEVGSTEELYQNALHASAEVDRRIAELEAAGEW